jgi:hypothetical protein
MKTRVLRGLLTLCSCCMAQEIVDDTRLEDGTGSTLPGLTSDVLEIDVDAQLRSWGINPQGNGPLFVVRYLVVPEKVYSVDISVMQWVQLVRDPSVKVLITTWSTVDSATGAGTPNWTVQTIRDALQKRMDKFIAAWLSENPGVKVSPH